jgi:nucleoid DNA-binding protein
MSGNKFTRADMLAVMTAAGTEIEQAQQLTALIIEALAANLAAGKVVELRGFGTLEPRERKARTKHNPRTMAPVTVPARKVIFFRPAGSLKRALNGEGGSPMQ